MDALVIAMHSKMNVIVVCEWMHWLPYALGTQRYHGLGMAALHGCCLLLKHEHHARNYGFGMDALVTVCFRNTNVLMVWAWMLR